MEDEHYLYFNKREYKCCHCNGVISKLTPDNRRLLQVLDKYKDEGIYRLELHCICQCNGDKHMFLCTKCGATRKGKPNEIRRSKTHAQCLIQRCPSNSDNPRNQTEAGHVGSQNSTETNNEISMDAEANYFEAQADQFDFDQMESTCVMNYLNTVSPSELPKKSVDYFRRQCLENKTGKSLSVACALRQRGDQSVDNNRSISEMSSDEVDYHFLLAQIHRDSTPSISMDICQVMEVVQKTKNEVEYTKNIMWKEAIISCIQKAMRSKLSLGDELIGEIMSEAERNFEDDFAQRYLPKSKGFQNNMIPDFNAINRHYITGQYSLVKFVPSPDIHLVNHSPQKANLIGIQKRGRKKRRGETQLEFNSDETITEDDLPATRKYARISVTHAVNHLLAIGTPARFFRVGHDSDWYEDPIRRAYGSRNIERAHAKIKRMAQEQNIKDETRVAFLRPWSDSFENKNVAPKAEYNSIQVFTVTFVQDITRRYDLGTLPVALTYKKKTHKDIQIEILEEIAKLSTPTQRLWLVDGELKLIWTIVLLDSIFGDLPERCSNTSLSLGGSNKNMHNRFGVSSTFSPETTPSCSHCDISRIELVLKQNLKVSVGPCNKCSDWQRNIIEPKRYPLGPDETTGSHDVAVRLSFELLVNSIEDLCKWIQQCSKRPSRKKISTYLKHLCFLGTEADTFADEILASCSSHNFDVTSLPSYPELLKRFRQLGVELSHYPSLPMHLLFLGIMKALIKESHRLFNKSNSCEAREWRNLVDFMENMQRNINKISLEWCLPMTFTGKDDEVGTAKWTSNHYLSFARLSLYYFSFLDVVVEKDEISSETKRGIKAYKKMIFSFLLLVSYMFSEDFVPSTNIDQGIEHYVRIFLSACRHFDMNTRKSEKDDGKGIPFYVSKPNFFGLLNLADTVANHGPITTLWEGNNEAYIKFLKREMSVPFNNDSYLQIVMQKLVERRFFDWYNQDNQFMHQSGRHRTTKLKIYPKSNAEKDPKEVLKRGEPISGMLHEDGQLCICIRDKGGRVNLHELKFDDRVGRFCFDMWYSRVSIGNVKATLSSEKDVIDKSVDYFIVVSQTFDDDFYLSALICRSWKLRRDDGSLSLPLPSKETLLMLLNVTI